MLFRLAAPVQRKGSRFQQFTKRIPADLRDRLVGQKISIPFGDHVAEVPITASTQSIRFSLRTNDPAEVRARQADACAFLERYFAALRSNQPLSLTHRQITALAGEFYRAWSKGPDGMRTTALDPETNLISVGPLPDDEEAELLTGVSELLAEKAQNDGVEYQTATFGPLVDRMLREHCVPLVTPESRERLVEAFSKQLPKALETSSRIAGGDYSPDPALARIPSWELEAEAPSGSRPQSSLPFAELLKGWWAEAAATGRSRSTRESYTNAFSLLERFLGHDDASRVTPKDIVRFKDHRLSAINPKTGKPVSAKTVKDGDLIAFKSVFGWAVANLKLSANPAQGITVRSSKKVKLRARDFTEDEAKAILTAANHVNTDSHPMNSHKTRLATRWAPWLCAYSGARIGEIIQLRRSDFRQEAGAWVMRLSPEAGTIKGKEYRDVPVHQHLVEMGLLDFVKGLPEGGYLFMDFKPKSTFEGVWQSKKNRVSEFVRKIVTDPNVAPNHGWRHTFKSKGFEAGIQEKVLDALCGHAPASVGRLYGSVTLRTKIEALRHFPRYTVGEA